MHAMCREKTHEKCPHCHGKHHVGHLACSITKDGLLDVCHEQLNPKKTFEFGEWTFNMGSTIEQNRTDIQSKKPSQSLISDWLKQHGYHIDWEAVPGEAVQFKEDGCYVHCQVKLKSKLVREQERFMQAQKAEVPSAACNIQE